MSHIRPLAFFVTGDLADDYSRASLYLKDVAEHYPEALGLPPEPPQPVEKKPLLRRLKEAVSTPLDDNEWTTRA